MAGIEKLKELKVWVLLVSLVLRCWKRIVGGRAPADDYSLAEYSWLVPKGSPLRVSVFQPADFGHASDESLNEVLEYFFGALPAEDDVLRTTSTRARTPYDLLVLPEAYLRVATLERLLDRVQAYGLQGCIHSGLRPTGSGTHLFEASSTRELIAIIRRKGCAEEDIAQFDKWFKGAKEPNGLNLAILIARDQSGALRACLHPKLVASGPEDSLEAETAMEEGTLISRIHLAAIRITDNDITILPLICADLCGRHPRRHGRLLSPLGTFADHWRGNVQIVSTVLASPTMRGGLHMKQQFRDIFVRAAHGEYRGTFTDAFFVFANYRRVEGRDAGLSGLWCRESSMTAISSVCAPPLGGRVAAYARPPNAVKGQLLPAGDDEGWVYTELLSKTQLPKDAHWDTLGIHALIDPASGHRLASFRLHISPTGDPKSLRFSPWAVDLPGPSYAAPEAIQ